MVFSFFGSFVPHFQIKLNIHASNFNSTFESMSELELFLLRGWLLCEPRAGSRDDGSISRVFLGVIYKRPIAANVDSYDRGNYYT